MTPMAASARRLLAAVSCLALLAQATGAADLVPVLDAARFPPPPPPAATVISPAPPRPASPAAPAVAPAPAEPPLVRVPDAPPIADRILVKKEKGFVGAATTAPADINELVRRLRARAEGRRPVFADRLEQPWVEGRGLRLRVVFLKPVGVTWGDAAGFHGQVLPQPIVDLRTAVPAVYRRSFPLYFAGDRVDYEIEVENAGPLPLPALTLRARQERFQTSGDVGRPLGPEEVQEIPPLPWGGRAILHGAFTLSPSGRERLNFEQTHLTVSSPGAAEAAPLLDAPQAGIADPPRR